MSRNNEIQYFLKPLVIAFALCFVGEISAEASALKEMFNRFKDNSNYTSAGGFQDQAAGHYTGGGLAVRNRTKSIQPIRISLPHIGASCSGIDAYFGSISFVKKDELTQMMRRMGSAAPSYAFQLALKTLSPEIEGLMKELRKILMDANALMLDECKMTQQLFAAAMPKGSEFLKHACTDVSSQSSQGDWFGARNKCAQDAAERKRAEETIKKKSPDQLVGEYNLTWHALMKVSGLKSNTELAEFIQSVVGTIISRNEGGDHPRVSSIHGKGDNENFIENYLKGGQVQVLKCDETSKCLNPSWQLTTQGLEKSLSQKIYSVVDAIQQKFLSKEPFTPEEVSFIEGVQGTPLFGFIQVSIANKGQMLMEQVITYVAYGFLMNELEEFASQAIEYLDALKEAQMETSDIDRLKKNIQQLRRNISRKKGEKELMIATFMQKKIQLEKTKARSRSW